MRQQFGRQLIYGYTKENIKLRSTKHKVYQQKPERREREREKEKEKEKERERERERKRPVAYKQVEPACYVPIPQGAEMPGGIYSMTAPR